MWLTKALTGGRFGVQDSDISAETINLRQKCLHLVVRVLRN